MNTEPSATPIVRLANVSKVYGMGDTQVTALNDVTVDFYSGEFTAIMGPSGSGKSTMMHILAGLDSLTSGRVLIESTEITALKDADLTKLRRDRIGFIFQSFNLIPTLDAKANILLPLELAGQKVDEDWFSFVVSSLGLEQRLNHRPSELSGGQQQRVAVARALMSRPALLMNPRVTWILTRPQRFLIYCAERLPNWVSPSLWLLTMFTPQPTLIASWLSVTAKSCPIFAMPAKSS